MAINEGLNPLFVIDFTQTLQKDTLEDKISIYSDTSETSIAESYESDGEFCALDLLLSNIWSTQGKLPQNFEAIEEGHQTRSKTFCNLRYEPSISHLTSVSTLNLLGQFVGDNHKNNHRDEIWVEKGKYAKILENANDKDKLNVNYKSNFSPEQSWLDKYQENLGLGSQVTQSQENYYCFPEVSGDNCSISACDGVDGVDNLAVHQNGESSQLPARNEFSNFPFSSNFSPVDSKINRYKENIANASQSAESQESNRNYSSKYSGENYKCLVGNHFSKDLTSSNAVTQQKDASSQETTQNYHRKNVSILRKHLAAQSAIYALKTKLECLKSSKSFSRKLIYKAHPLNRCDSLPFKCDICAKEYPFESQLKNHYRIHASEKPFKCDQCTFSTSWTSSLRRHLERCHVN